MVTQDRCVFRARARVPTSYEAMSEHYYGNPNHAAEISAAAGTPPGSMVPENTYVQARRSQVSTHEKDRQPWRIRRARSRNAWPAHAGRMRSLCSTRRVRSARSAIVISVRCNGQGE